MSVISWIFFTMISCQFMITAEINASEKELVNVLIESINSKSVDNLKPFLSESFVITGRKPPVSLLILEQLVRQLNEHVESHRLIRSEKKSNGDSIHSYLFEYRGMGEKEVSITIDEDGKIQELELVKITVKTLTGKAEVTKPDTEVLRIPFELKNNLILVEAELSGEKKTFIFDSGSPRLILNRASNKDERFSSLQGVHGNINNLDIVDLSEMDFFGIKMKNQKVLTADLSHLETAIGSEIAGLIGFELFDGYDVLYNYGEQELMLIDPKRTSQFVMAFGAQLKTHKIEFERKSHIPIFQVFFGDREFTMGLDSGASSNLLALSEWENLQSHLSESEETDLSGAESTSEKVLKANVNEMTIAELQLSKIPTVFKDISHLQKAYGDDLDGLAGYEFLSRQISLVSYSEKRIYLFTPK